MTKKTFLKKLETKLVGLDEKAINRILKKYEKIIDDEMASGKDEKDVIAALGDIDLIAKIYTDKSDDDEVKKDKEKVASEDKAPINKWIDTVLKGIDNTFNNVDDQLAKRVLLILCFIFVASILAAIVHIPFKILEVIGISILSIIFNHHFLYQITTTMWVIGLNICYAILIIWFIVQFVQAIISKYSDKEYLKTIKKEVKNESKEEKVTRKNNDTSLNGLFDVVFVILKVFIIILTIPFLMTVAGLVIALLFVITLITQGVAIIGLALLLLGLILLFGSLLDIIYTSLSKRGDK